MTRTIARFCLSIVSAACLSFALLSMPVALHAQGKEKATKGSVSVTGCLQKGSETGGYYITENDKMWELSSRSVKLDEHVGHEVTVTGAPVKKSKAVEKKAGENEKSESSGKAYADLNVRSLKMVSETCSRP